MCFRKANEIVLSPHHTYSCSGIIKASIKYAISSNSIMEVVDNAERVHLRFTKFKIVQAPSPFPQVTDQ